MKKDIGLYIHIPFCKSKCYYCDFVSFANKEKYIEDYINAIIKEIKYIDLSKYSVKTVYIGGGTPSILESIYITKIFNELKPYIDKEAEITIEINPGTVDKEKLKVYKEARINRLSIGLQATENELLNQIGRIHKFEDFLKTYNNARELGFKNINVDLMLGLPNQTEGILEHSLEKIITLNPEHISVYSLILEEGTKLYDMVNTGKIELPDEETERKMYWKAKNILEKNGYIQYEISNFAKKGYESKHNTDCWEQKEYIGIGASAHSYLNGIRYSNIENVEEYIENIKNDKFEKNHIIHEKQTKKDKQKEFMLLGLRKIKGVSIKEFENKFEKNPIILFKQELKKLTDEGLIEINENSIKLTNKGLDLANMVWREFV